MANHKYKKPKTSRAGCLMCKYWKISPGRYRSKRKLETVKLVREQMN